MPTGRDSFQLAQLGFDLHLPNAGNAQHESICAVLAGSQHVGRESSGITVPPNERVRVEQKSSWLPQPKIGRQRRIEIDARLDRPDIQARHSIISGVDRYQASDRHVLFPQYDLST